MDLREVIRKLESEIALFKLEIEALEEENSRLRSIAAKAERIEAYLVRARDRFDVDQAGRYLIDGLIEGMRAHGLD